MLQKIDIRNGWLVLALVLAFWGCVDDGRGGSDRDSGPAYDPDTADSDGDTISDSHDGDEDADGDGDANLDDLDSDGDGISDSDEAGDADLSTPPFDADEDGTPNFLDLDSDDNGIKDSDESSGDIDGDGVLNAHDLDDDEDGIADVIELGEDPDNPVDSDGDGVPDYWDADSDGDGILDLVEGTGDMDADGIPNYLDDDSDGDGISDGDEGDGNVDGDGSPNFLDVDSDGDLISDELEVANGTSPLLADTDGDGSNDLIETALGTDPLDPEDNPANNGDLVFVSAPRTGLPPGEEVFSTTTNYQELDVYFLFDTTCSMGGVLSSMRAAAQDLIETLTCESSGVSCEEDSECSAGEVCSLTGECIEDPANNGCVPSFWSGTGTYEGGACSTSSPDTPIKNRASVSSNSSGTASSIPTSVGTTSCDENLFEAAYCMASPGLCSPGAILDCATTGIGCPGYRDGAVRVLVQITDEMDEENYSYTAASAGAQLAAEGINYLGIDCASNHEGLDDLEAVATAAGSIDTNGQPFVRSGNSAAVAGEIQSALDELIDLVPMEVTVDLEEMEGDSGDALPFFDYLVVNEVADIDGDGVPDCTEGLTTSDSDSNGYDDMYNDVEPNNRVCWSFFTSSHEAPGSNEVQTYKLQVTIRGNGAILDRFIAWWVVPPAMLQS